MSTPLLEVTGITKSYGSVHALRGLDLRVDSGRIFGVVGPNGAGKTTLFSVVCGFTAADTGTVRVAGKLVTPTTPPPRGSMAILPQDALLGSRPSIGAQLAYLARLGGLAPEHAKAEARRVLALVDLADVHDRRPHTMSHGMSKRVGIAQAFMGEPQLIILDEPTAGLDPHAAADIRQLIRGIRGDRTIVVSSHNLAEIEDLCHEVAIVHEGAVVRQQTLSEVLGEAAQLIVRLSTPPDAGLLSDLQGLGVFAQVAFDQGADRLRIDFDPKALPAGRAAQRLVTELVERDVVFVELQVGKRLEDRFLEETS
ncbi:MAG: ABC transporter ATP-binding protein [Myxococcota bacterium]